MPSYPYSFRERLELELELDFHRGQERRSRLFGTFGPLPGAGVGNGEDTGPPGALLLVAHCGLLAIPFLPNGDQPLCFKTEAKTIRTFILSFA